MKKIPKKYENLVFVLCMAFLMGGLMSFAITAINLGFGPHFLAAWKKSFMLGFSVAFPTALFVVPLVRKFIVAKIVEQ